MTLFSLGTLLAMVLLAVVGVSLLIAFTLRRVVPTNEVHIVQYRKQTVPFGKGLEAGNVYYHWPAFLPVIGLNKVVYPVSNFDLALKDYIAYDKDRVQFLLDLVAFFRINEPNTAAQRVANFEELQGHLLAILQGAARKILASHDINAIMLERSILGEQFTSEVAPQLANWGVEAVKNIELMNVKDTNDSEVIHRITAIRTSEIEKESRVKVADNHRQAEEAEIQNQRQIELQRQEAEQQIGQRTAEKDKAVGMSQEKSKQEVLSEQRETVTRHMAVTEIQNVRTAEITKQVNLVKADEQAKTAIIVAEGQKQQTVIVAEGNLEAKKRESTGIEVEGAATAAAALALAQVPVTAQITLAKEIGTNNNYQTYLIGVRQIEANQAIGIAQADALKDAGIKIIANTGTNLAEGIHQVTDLFSARGGAAIGAMLETIASTDAGKKVVEKVTQK